MDKTKCKKLYNEYKECKDKIDKTFRLYQIKNPPINTPFIDLDLEKRKRIANLINLNCKECLSSEELFEISSDLV